MYNFTKIPVLSERTQFRKSPNSCPADVERRKKVTAF
jgi:hypothetical protein